VYVRVCVCRRVCIRLGHHCHQAHDDVWREVETEKGGRERDEHRQKHAKPRGNLLSHVRKGLFWGERHGSRGVQAAGLPLLLQTVALPLHVVRHLENIVGPHPRPARSRCGVKVCGEDMKIHTFSPMSCSTRRQPHAHSHTHVHTHTHSHTPARDDGSHATCGRGIRRELGA